MALTTDINNPRRDGVQFGDPVAAGAVIYAGALYALNATGFAVPAGTAGAGIARGVAEARADNTGGADGDISVAGRAGVFRFDNSASTDLIARADIGATAYVVDDDTVAKTDNSGARKAAGTIVDVDDVGVWVRVG
jgi:hypothetical protein